MSNKSIFIKSVFKHYPADFMFLILLAWLLPAVYSLLNRYFIGYMSYESIVTEQSFEALEVIMEVFLEMFPLAVLALVSRRFKNTTDIISIVKSAFILQLAITLLFVIINYFSAYYFIDWINTPESSRNLALDYFRVRGFSLPFSTLAALMVISIKSMRRGGIAIFIVFLNVLINYILDALFISDYSFSLKLGLMGSAWNNVMSNALTMIISVIIFKYLVRSDSSVKLHKESSIAIYKIGRWTGLESLVRNLGYIIGVVAVVNFIGKVEPDAIIGYNTTMMIMWGITLIPVLAWTEATQIAIGNAYGDSDFDAMKKIQIVSVVILTLYILLWIPAGVCYWEPLSRWLNKGVNDTVVCYSMITFNYLIFPYILFTIGSGLKTIFIGTGRPLFVLIPSAIVNIMIYIPFGLMVKYNVISINYINFLLITLSVFTIDFVFTVFFLYKKGYTFEQ